MAQWLTWSTFLGIGVAAAFTGLAFRSLPGAVYVFSLLGALPWIRVGAFAGNEIVQSLLLTEVLATALISVWVLRRGPAVLGEYRFVPFGGRLLLLVIASILSLVSGLAWMDHTVPQRNVKIEVSIGQILLFLWPIGIYLVTADQIRDADWIRRFRRTVMFLAVPQVVMLLRPSAANYLSWSWYFGLVAAPLACARIADERSWLRKSALTVLVMLPLLEGLRKGKAFLYVYVTVTVLVVLWARARRVFAASVAVLAGAVIVMQLLPNVEQLLSPLKWLIEIERAQQSWGGRAGRLALAADAVGVWMGHPLLGVGPGNSYPYMLRYSVIGTPHGQFTNLLVELGVLGVALFTWFVAGVIRFGTRVVRVPGDPDVDSFLLGWFASFVAWSVCSLGGDYMLHSVRNGGLEMFSGFYLQWVFLGVAIGISRLQRERVRVHQSVALHLATWGSQRPTPVAEPIGHWSGAVDFGMGESRR